MSFLSVRSFGLLCATFFVGLLAAPAGYSDAFAGCGDYVHLGHDDADPAIDPPLADFSNRLPLRAQTRRPEPVPCHGPACNQNPRQPTAPAPHPVSTGADQKAWLDARVEASPTGPERIVPDAVIVPDDVRKGRRERPPRRRS